MVDQLHDLADSRLLSGCIYCGGTADTRDHVPSRVFLDAPYPDNLPIVPACLACNNSFSKDEEYLACLIESAVVGVADPSRMRRERVAGILQRSSALQSQLTAARTEAAGQIQFQPDPLRLQNVVLKLARGHAAFELSQQVSAKPAFFLCAPLASMGPAQLEAFESAHFPMVFGEVGSRGMQRMAVVQTRLRNSQGEEFTSGFILQDWVEVQPERYRYLATHDVDGIRVRCVIGDYLGCDVRWDGSGFED